MRIATFNIMHGLSPSDGAVDEDRFAGAIRSLDADVLALQEVDRDQPRSRGLDLTAIAAAAMGAVDCRFAAAMTGLPGGSWQPATDADPPGMPSYGVALLSRYPAHDWQTLRLAALRPRVPYSFTPGRITLVKDEARVAVRASIDSPVGSIVVVATHLSFLPWWRTVQLKKMMTAMYQVWKPVVLLGDLNMEPNRVRRHSGMRPLASGMTFPAVQPNRQIDHIVVRGLEVAGPSSATRLPVSDHRALTVDLAV
jgi:endonuclease/exonuclease/phosphatase family metal-dependent hydrolase